MGWNDRLPEDPYIPYSNQDDQDSYDNWQMYLEACRLEGLTSQNVDPAAVVFQPEQPAVRDLPRQIITTPAQEKQQPQEK